MSGAPSCQPARLLQGTVDRRGAVRQQPRPELGGQLAIAVPFHAFDQERHHRAQPLATDPVGRLPRHDERLARGAVMHAAARSRTGNRHVPPARSTSVACLRWNPVTAVNSSRIRPWSALIPTAYRATTAAGAGRAASRVFPAHPLISPRTTATVPRPMFSLPRSTCPISTRKSRLKGGSHLGIRANSFAFARRVTAPTMAHPPTARSLALPPARRWRRCRRAGTPRVVASAGGAADPR